MNKVKMDNAVVQSQFLLCFDFSTKFWITGLHYVEKTCELYLIH